jgi:hypothetical protein
MMSKPIITLLGRLTQFKRSPQLQPLNHWGQDQARLPRFVRQSPVARRYLQLLSPLAWDILPPRPPQPHDHQPSISYATFAAARLRVVKLDQQLVSMGALRRYLLDHPELVSLLAFPVVKSRLHRWRFDPEATLPTQRHLTRLLRAIPNAVLQLLLDSTVASLQTELTELGFSLGQTISLDTKHILAWVKENNPKAYLKADRFDKTRQPKGDPDCKLGCKRKRNQRASSKEPPPTPAEEPVPAVTISVGEYYWGYGSGVVVTKVPTWGEVVLAELTQPFDQHDVSYFFPLMADVERRLGFRPQFGAFDAAFDAFYVYEYFHSEQHNGFAAVPFSERGGYRRTFDEHGLPLCQAGLPMPLKYTFWSKTTLIQHQRGRHVCPLLFPQETGQSCPVNHKQWPKGGCTTTMATSIGARLRYQLDRNSAAYKQIYRQRTAIERINSQAVELGIERPTLRVRNGQAIANLNTLIYTLINLRTLHRIRRRKARLLAHERLPISSP